MNVSAMREHQVVLGCERPFRGIGRRGRRDSFEFVSYKAKWSDNTAKAHKKRRTNDLGSEVIQVLYQETE